jgi:hypothetical protein
VYRGVKIGVRLSRQLPKLREGKAQQLEGTYRARAKEPYLIVDLSKGKAKGLKVVKEAPVSGCILGADT